MKSPDSRFYCPHLQVGILTLDENESAHAVRVCRATVGDILLLSDGEGHFAEGKILNANIKACEVEVNAIKNAPSPKPHLNIAIGCLKDDALEEVVFHASQTEVNRIIFLRTDYSQEPKNSDLKKLVRRSELKSVVSLKQSKKAWLTKIEGPLPLKEFLASYHGDLVLCDIDGEKNIPQNENLTKDTTLLIGPEGGFSPTEIETIKNFPNGKVHLLKLGNTRLRARTAALIALGKF